MPFNTEALYRATPWNQGSAKKGPFSAPMSDDYQTMSATQDWDFVNQMQNENARRSAEFGQRYDESRTRQRQDRIRDEMSAMPLYRAKLDARNQYQQGLLGSLLEGFGKILAPFSAQGGTGSPLSGLVDTVIGFRDTNQNPIGGVTGATRPISSMYKV